MRRFATLVGTSVLVALAAACSSNTQHVGGAPSPNGLSPSVSPSATPAPSATPTTDPSTKAPSSPPTSSPADPDLFLITRSAIGPLKMGMSTTAAKNTGVVTLRKDAANCGGADWKNLKADDPNAIIFNPKLGAVYLHAYGHQHTAAGISLASSPTAVKKAYPNVTVFDEGDGTTITSKFSGRLYSKLDGHNHYRFSFNAGKMVELAIESDLQGCYE